MNSMPPPKTMKVLKTIGAEKTQQLDHRLIDQLGIKAIEAGMVVIQSATNFKKSSVVMPVWVTAMILRKPVLPSAASALRSRSIQWPSMWRDDGCHPILALRQRRRLRQPLPEALREGGIFVGRIRAFVHAGELFQVGKRFRRIDAAEFVEIIRYPAAQRVQGFDGSTF
jgi:hypothetical protein